MAKIGDRFLVLSEFGDVQEYEIMEYSPNGKKIRVRPRNPFTGHDHWYSGKDMKDWNIEMLPPESN